ncbi:unnamed protein product, partial [Brassica oleracea]
ESKKWTWRRIILDFSLSKNEMKVCMIGARDCFSSANPILSEILKLLRCNGRGASTCRESRD